MILLGYLPNNVFLYSLFSAALVPFDNLPPG